MNIQRVIDTTRIFRVDPQEILVRAGSLHQSSYVLIAEFLVELQAEVGRLDMNIAIQLLLLNRVEHLFVFAHNLSRRRTIFDKLAEHASCSNASICI